MKLEQQVCSLELAKRLKELGVEQESVFRYSVFPHGQVTLKYSRNISFRVTEIAAFTVAELGEMLPYEMAHFLLKRRDGTWGWRQFHIITTAVYLPDLFATEADARAKMLIYLLENKLITL